MNATITPSLLLPNNKGEVFLSFHQVGKRYADGSNTIVLPAYHTLDFGVRYQISDSLSANLSVQNVRNTIGLTEGNPRSNFKSPIRVLTVTGRLTLETTIFAIATIAPGSRSQPEPAPRLAIFGTQQPQLMSMKKGSAASANRAASASRSGSAP